MKEIRSDLFRDFQFISSHWSESIGITVGLDQEIWGLMSNMVDWFADEI